MTRAEMIIYFKELYNLSSNTNDGKLDDEIDIYLNLAQDEFIDKQLQEEEGTLELRVIKNSNKAYNNIRTLLKTSSSLTIAADVEISNISTTDFPSDMRYGLMVRCQITRIDSNPLQAWYIGKSISSMDVWKYAYSPKNNPSISTPLYTVLNGKLNIITDNSATLDAVKLDYIKEPVKIGSIVEEIVVGCELPQNTHYDLVKEAVNIALKSSSVEAGQKLAIELQEGKQ